MKTSAGKLGALALAALLGTAALSGCTSSATVSQGSSTAGSTGAADTGASAPDLSQPTASGSAQGSAAQGTTTAAAAKTTAPKKKPTATSTVLPASLPTTGSNDIQRLVDPLDAAEANDVNTPLRFQRELDPSTAANALRTWVLNPFAPDLLDYDQTAYGLHGETKPYMDVAIASPKYGVGSQPDYIGGIMAAAGATSDVYTPSSYSSHLAGYNTAIRCGHETLHGRTVCVWMGMTPGGGHVPFVGVLVILSTVPTDKAAVIAADIVTAMTS